MSILQSQKFKDARNGAVLQMVEAVTLGMPLEVWKTRMGRFRNETTMEAFRNVYHRAGGGVSGVAAFWAGTMPKLIESASKGAVLMLAKEWIKTACLETGVDATTTGFLAGAGGGVAQVAVMGPCTYLVTHAVTGDKSVSVSAQIGNTWKKGGIKAFYPGGTALAFRQATNWASRQGFTDGIRELIKKTHPDPANAKLSVNEEVLAGMIGGALSCWNQPFEVARIEGQSRASMNQPSISMMQVFRNIVHEHGYAGLFKGVLPRMGLGVWQTTFMVTGANLIRDYILDSENKGQGGHRHH
eukprot:m.70042 g.70042  ORF g.70042 m.70042 type:complete len:299 (-) comp14286_c0_seq1:327-1223(-)